MTKSINKNLKIALIAVFALFLFALVNYSVGDSANANESNDGNVYKGKRIDNTDSYEFVENENLPTIILGKDSGYTRITDFSPCGKFDSKFEIHKDALHGEDKSKISGTKDDFGFGGGGNEGTKQFRFMDFEIVLAANEAGRTDNVIIVRYSKDTPYWSGTQHCTLNFRLDCYDDNGVFLKEFHMGDSFCDKYDFTDNSDDLERAGHPENGEGDQNFGDSFKDVLKCINECSTVENKKEDVVKAVVDGNLKITVEKITLDQECH